MYVRWIRVGTVHNPASFLTVQPVFELSGPFSICLKAFERSIGPQRMYSRCTAVDYVLYVLCREFGVPPRSLKKGVSLLCMPLQYIHIHNRLMKSVFACRLILCAHGRGVL